MLTNQQIAWAMQHDWCLGRVGQTVEIVDRWVNVNTGERGEDVMVWNKSFRELRNWAGY